MEELKDDLLIYTRDPTGLIDNIFFQILELLDQSSLIYCRQVSSQWNDAIAASKIPIKLLLPPSNATYQSYKNFNPEIIYGRIINNELSKR